MSQLVITRNIGETAVAKLTHARLGFSHNKPDVSWTQQMLIANAKNAEALVCLLSDKMSAEVMDALPNLKLIANVAVGYDNIDVQAATERGIIVTNTPDVLTETTADLAFALLLAIARRIPESDSYMRAEKYTRFELFPDMLGMDVCGKTLGIVGMGRIGTAVARRGALGFSMPILYCGRSQNEAAAAEFGATFVSFNELLAKSDFVSVNVALTPETTHLFDINTFRKMKQTACLINTARGPVVKEADLVTALKTGLLRGAALDVFEFEPKMVAGLADIHDKLVVTPHIGSATIDTRHKMADIAVNNVLAYFAGERPLTMVNPEVFDNQ
ncbi:MAG: D-glycerate dehydrogenase [Chloroflexota bacterium]